MTESCTAAPHCRTAAVARDSQCAPCALPNALPHALFDTSALLARGAGSIRPNISLSMALMRGKHMYRVAQGLRRNKEFGHGLLIRPAGPPEVLL